VIPLRTLQEIIARQAAIKLELDSLATMAEPEGDEAARSQTLADRNTVTDELLAEWDVLDEERKPLAARQERLDAVRTAAQASPSNRERGTFEAPNVNIKRDGLRRPGGDPRGHPACRASCGRARCGRSTKRPGTCPTPAASGRPSWWRAWTARRR
jgi:hypothetical protein